MPDTTYKEEDYAGLPTELNGKSPAEIAAYYERKAVERPPPAAPPANPLEAAPRNLTTADLYADPAKAIASVAPTREELASVNPTLIAAAELVAKSKHSDWDNFETEIKGIMASCSPEGQRDAQMWETAYYNVKGHKTDDLVKAAAVVASAPGGETPTPAGLLPPKEEGLKFPQGMETKGETMLVGLDVSREGYLTAQQKIEQGAWPLTMDNIKRR